MNLLQPACFYKHDSEHSSTHMFTVTDLTHKNMTNGETDVLHVCLLRPRTLLYSVKKAPAQLQTSPKVKEKRAEVLKVRSRRSDHLCESCAVKHWCPWELLLPTLQSLNKTLPWLNCSPRGSECSFRHLQQKAACRHGLDAKPCSVQSNAAPCDTGIQTDNQWH